MDTATLIDHLQDELDGAALCRALAEAEKDPQLSEVYRRMADAEQRHAQVWADKLEAAGVTRVDQVGVPFDPNLHEAVTTRPTDHAAKDHTVGAVLQPGYRMGGVLIRPARVVVLTWAGDEDRGKTEA